MVSHDDPFADLTGSHRRSLVVVVPFVGGKAAAAEVRLQGGGTGRTMIHAADYWRCKALCGLFQGPLLPTFLKWAAPAPDWAERCTDCLLLISADVNGDAQTSPQIAPDHIWTWTGSPGERMTVAADAISFVLLPHLYLRRRFLPWEEIEAFAPGYMGRARGGGRLWFPELVPQGGRSRRKKRLPGVLFDSEDEAERAASLVNTDPAPCLNPNRRTENRGGSSSRCRLSAAGTQPTRSQMSPGSDPGRSGLVVT